MEKNKEISLVSDNYHVLDKTFELIRSCYKHNDWEEAEVICQHMRKIAEKLYSDQKKWGDILPSYLKRPIIFYIGYSYLAESILYQKQRRFTEAKEAIQQYAKLDRYELFDQNSQEEIERFQHFAKANSYANDILSGNRASLGDYVEFLKLDEEEVLPGLITILEAANFNGWIIDEAISEFIPKELEAFSCYEDQGNRVYYIKLLNQLAIYEFGRKNYNKTIEYILSYLTKAVKMDAHREFIVIISMFETIRSFATSDQENCYQLILKGAC
ncbi:hypothetical protein J2Z69_001019 [Paenibacillus shirakamiensis]|uniref:DNA-binding protein n=1 Tax=Paenibacillus shirakamiensis TaxID=1265935 RepID=A0ABS4JE58_9BACL|nr:DNA-binding protein [Paenibacillus shirakamiensis]MBP2000000.1 hypothetical protein [Paenibacillus shirakamiensis]